MASEVTDPCYDRPGKAECFHFLKKVARAYPRRELRLVVDNYQPKRDVLIQWLAKHARIALPCTRHPGRG